MQPYSMNHNGYADKSYEYVKEKDIQNDFINPNEKNHE